MDGSRFDDVTRSLAGGASRRGFLGVLAALAAGLARVTGAGAACPPGQVQGAGRRCLCKLTGRPPVAGACPCPAGQTDTGDGLGCQECRVDTHCPVPSDPCLAVTCEAGSCTLTPVPDGEPGACPTGQTCCGGACGECQTAGGCGTAVACGAAGDCFTFTTAEGRDFCASDFLCSASTACEISEGCPGGPGAACVIDTCCGGPARCAVGCGVP